MQAKNLTTIVIPAIGTGNLSFPRDRVANISLDEVAAFSQNNPTSAIKEVRFVVYDKDQPTVQAFQAEFQSRQPQDQPQGKKRRRAKGVPRAAASAGVPSVEVEDAIADEVELERTLDPNKPKVLIGSILVQAETGDITQETTDAIVTVSNTELNVAHGGGVGAAILRAGGPSIQTECSSLKKAASGSVVCTRAGNLPTTHIYHMVPSFFDESSLKDLILKCLCKADSDGMTSISFPAVGTGNYGLKPKSAAKVVLAAVEQFNQSQPTCLASVRLVVFQKHMLKDYHDAMREGLAPASRGGGLLFKVANYIGGWLGFGRETGPSASHVANPGYPSRDLIRFTVHAGNKKDLKDAEKAIEDLVVENYKYKEIENDAVAKLSSKEKTQILQLQDKHETRIEIEEKVGRIVVRGDPDDVLSVATEIFAMLNKTVEEEHSRGFAELMYENIQWCFDDSGDLEPYEKDVNAQIETAYRKGDKSVIFIEDGDRYEIVFKDKLETNLESRQTTSVVRKEIGKGGH